MTQSQPKNPSPSNNNKKLLTGVRSLVDLKILRPREYLSAAGKRAWEWFLAGVHPYVVDKFVFGLERSTVPRASLPEARVRGALRATHMLHG